VAQLAEGTGLQLTDPFPRDSQLDADLLERPPPRPVQAVAEHEHALEARLEFARKEMARVMPDKSHRFAFTRSEHGVDTTCPWGNRIRCHLPSPQWGKVQLGLAYLDFDVPAGTADGIARFYREVGAMPDADFVLYLHRVAQLDGGVSPILPLIVGGIGFAAWCTWHLARIHKMRELTAFEAACLGRVDARVEDALNGTSTAAGRDDDPWRSKGLSTLSRPIVKAVNDARNRLFLMVPDWPGVLGSRYWRRCSLEG
jgi:hypothetical protein